MKILKNNLIIYYVLLPFFLFLLYFLEKVDIIYYQVVILLLYIVSLLYSIKKNFIIITLFLVSLFVFQYGRLVLLPLISNQEIMISWFHYYVFEKSTVKFMYKILLFNILGILLGMIFFKTKTIIKNYNKELLPITRRVFFVILFISFLFFLLNNYLFLKKFYFYGGYLNYYLGTKEIKINIIIRMLSAIFYPLLTILLAYYYDDKKYKYILFLLFFITNFIFSLKGARSPLFNSIFVLFYLNIKKFKLKNLIVMLCFCSCFILSLNFFSSIRNENVKRNLKINEKINDFIFSQGITGTFLGLLKDKPELFDRKIPYIFSSVIGNKVARDSKEKLLCPGNIDLDSQLSARSSYLAFRKGHGMGGNYIIEMYDIGKIYGVLILSFLHTYISLYFFQNIKKFNNNIKIILIFILNYYFTIPRANYFPNIFNIRLVYIIFIYFVMLLIDKLFKIRNGR